MWDRWQKTVLKATAFELLRKLLADEIWQYPALSRPLRLNN